MAGGHGSGHGAAELADLFFRADEVLTENDRVRTNELRRNYRQWRKGEEGVEPHADPLALKHIATTEESRARSKMRRVKTYGGELGGVGGTVTPSWSRSNSPPPDSSSAQVISASCTLRTLAVGEARCARPRILVSSDGCPSPRRPLRPAPAAATRAGRRSHPGTRRHPCC